MRVDIIRLKHRPRRSPPRFGGKARYASRAKVLALALSLCASVALIPASAPAGVFVSVNIAPPPLPVYDQPPIPGEGYLWTPGYWAWDGDAGQYYWVPGAWVLPPEPGLLWTPGYWGWSNGVYAWNAGYWGPTVGFYGGVCYGFGYTGIGFSGGYWSGGSFYYNRSVTNVSNTTVINNVYNKTVINNNVTNVSYNGGKGGLTAKPTPAQRAAAQQHHIAPTALQQQHQKLAAQDRALHFNQNHGKPPVAAVAKAGDFKGPGVLAAKSAGPAVPAQLHHDAISNHTAAHSGNPASVNRFNSSRFNAKNNLNPSGTLNRGGNPSLSNSYAGRFGGPTAYNARNPYSGSGHGSGRASLGPAFNRSYPPGNALAGRPGPGPRQAVRGRPPMHWPAGGPSSRSPMGRKAVPRLAGKPAPKWQR